MPNDRESPTADIDADLSCSLRELAAREVRDISSVMEEALRALRAQRRERTEDLQFVSDFMNTNRGAFDELAKE